LRLALGKNIRPYLKSKTKKTGGVAEVLEHLLSKCETLSSNHSAAQKNP
jgi:hypothetical protein